ncbi:MAG: polysaccharide biosynthesis C-terminal domain-containing protein [Balneolales bacterium]
MGRIRELFSDTLVYGISSVVARFINYLLVPFYTKFFDPAEYGVIGLIYGAIIFLNVLFQFGMESAYLRYAADRGISKDVFKTLQLLLLGAATLLAVLFWLLSPVITPLLSIDPTAQYLFLMMLGILWLDALSAVPFAELRLVRKSLTFALIRLGSVIINVGLNLYFIVLLGWGIEAILFANLIASGVTLALLFFFTFDQLTGSWNRMVLKKSIYFGIPYIPAGIGYAINETLDKFFLNQMSQVNITRLYGSDFTSEEITGIYNACYKLAVFMLLTVQMFRMAWQPFFMRHAKSQNVEKTFADVFLLFNLAAAIIFLAVGIFAVQIVQIRIPVLDGTLIDSRYWMGLSIVPYLLLAYWFQGWYVNFTAGIFIAEQTKKLPLITLGGAIITVTLNVLLIPVLGMQGAAIATLVCYAAMSLMILYYSRGYLSVPYQIGKAGVMMAIAVTGLILADSVSFPFINELAGKMVIFIISLVILIPLGLSTTKLVNRSRL